MPSNEHLGISSALTSATLFMVCGLAANMLVLLTNVSGILAGTEGMASFASLMDSYITAGWVLVAISFLTGIAWTATAIRSLRG